MRHDADDAAVRAIEDDYDQAWSRADLDQILRCLDDHVVLVSPRGQVAVGHEEARAALSAFLTTEAAGTKHHSEITRLSFVNEAVAVVDGTATITRGDDVVVTHPFTDVLKRSQGQWRIAHIRAYAFMG